jgi:hypothetical protein
MARSAWKRIARKLFGKEAVHHEGDGQFAFVTPCREFHYSLWPTRQEAEAISQRVTRTGCCGGCIPSMHYIRDLAA